MKKNDRDPVGIHRFESDFYTSDTANFLDDMQTLMDAYPDFYPVFTEGVLGITANYEDLSSYVDLLYEFRTHPSMIGLYDTIRAHFPDLKRYERQFSDAFAQYRKLYPGREIPEVVTFVSEFGNKAILYDHGIGISLDMFLGPQYPYYQGLQLPGYIIQHLTPDEILPNAMRVWAEEHVDPPGKDANFLEYSIYQAKKLYFAQRMLPKLPPWYIMEVTQDQWEWLEENEFNIWAHYLEEDLLYNASYLEYRRYVEEAPTTYGMPSESPGRTGIWTAWQIIDTYMRKHRDTPMETLMRDLTARKILEDSAYKPEPLP